MAGNLRMDHSYGSKWREDGDVFLLAKVLFGISQQERNRPHRFPVNIIFYPTARWGFAPEK
jgi:hypothetical protein